MCGASSAIAALEAAAATTCRGARFVAERAAGFLARLSVATRFVPAAA